MKVLITGGAGYIGSTIATACLDNGFTPIILDNLSTGRREFTAGRTFYEGEISDGQLVDRVFRDHPDIYAVIHCAALNVVPDSVGEPLRYYRENVGKSLELFEHLLRNGCQRAIFSSTAAIYAPGPNLVVDEESEITPTSPYGRSKAMLENILADIAAAADFRVLSLRYFNPIGADPKMRTGLQIRHPTHALGRMIEAIDLDRPFEITGTDFPTPDGTGIRDYLHVWDLARAHIAALERFDTILPLRRSTTTVINLGAGRGTTVRELIAALDEARGEPLKAIEAERRPGDVTGSYTRIDRARELLKWECEYTVADGVRHSLEWAAIRDTILGTEE